MARIRTIKPDFFTSDDVCALSPLARLLYIGLWCEADREGRMVWAPRSFKRRYLPDDACEIDQLCEEIISRKLVRLYGDGLAVIPTFSKHQHVNPREAQSVLPEPHPVNDASPRVTHASPPVPDAQVGKERKEGEGKEGEGRRVTHARALPDDWKPDEEDLAWARTARPDLDAAALDAETERFRNHANAHARTAHRWGPSWRLWVSKAHAPKVSPGTPAKGETPRTIDHDSHDQWRARLKSYRPGKFWLEGDWGPRPETGKSRVPPDVLNAWRQETHQ